MHDYAWHVRSRDYWLKRARNAARAGGPLGWVQALLKQCERFDAPVSARQLANVQRILDARKVV
jgi:hypothetical protein